MNALQRRQQIGRIHACKSTLHLAEADYRELLTGLTGLESTKEMTDAQVNHVLDWMNFLAGRRRQPLSFNRNADQARSNLVRLCYAICGIVPPGYETAPMLSESWQVRMVGRFEPHFEAFQFEELMKLIEGLKYIFRRQGQRDTESLVAHTLKERELPLWGVDGGAAGRNSPPSTPIPPQTDADEPGGAAVFSEAV
jgi:hypothetical protein